MLRKWISGTALTLAAAALLTAAGCGETTTTQSTGELSQGTVPGVPKASLIVTNTAPYNGQLDVSQDSTVTVSFNTNINPSSVNATNFRVERAADSAQVAGTFTTNPLSIVFTPAAPLQIGTLYRVILKQQLTSSTGGSLAKPLTWTFTANNGINMTPLQLSSHHVADNNAFNGWYTLPFSYEDITATGTDSGVYGDDQTSGPINIGFTFNYYGTAYTQLYIGSNGYLTFGSGDTTFGNYPFPSSDSHVRIAPYFDDLVVSAPGKIVYQTLGSAPNRRFVVQYSGIQHYPSSTPGEFEVTLYENSSKGSNVIQFQYYNVSALGSGGSATVGLNKGDGIDDTLYSYNNSYLANGRSITLIPAGNYGLTTLTPYNGQAGVSRSTTFYAFFNKPLDVATIPGAFSLVQTAGAVPVPTALETGIGAGNSVVYSVPAAPLAALTNHTASFSTALADIYGVHLATPITWSFTTGP